MYRFTESGPFDREGMAELRERLAAMSSRELAEFYSACHYMCRPDEHAPRAAFVQQLVAAWKEIRRRERARARLKSG